MYSGTKNKKSTFPAISFFIELNLLIRQKYSQKCDFCERSFPSVFRRQDFFSVLPTLTKKTQLFTQNKTTSIEKKMLSCLGQILLFKIKYCYKSW